MHDTMFNRSTLEAPGPIYDHVDQGAIVFVGGGGSAGVTL
jgi:hypothetical protein